jgi:flagellar biosynthetic protein FliR
MINVSLIQPEMLIAFWLIFTRWMTALLLIPLFDENAIPSIIKILISVVITYAFFPYLQEPVIADIKAIGASHFWLLTIYYTVIGLLVGFGVKIIMSSFVAAGSLISHQIGFTAMNMFDPNSAAQVGPFEILFRWVLTMMLLVSGGLTPIFKGLYLSFYELSFVNFNQTFDYYNYLNDFLKGLFMTSLLLASPLLFLNLMLNALLGVISRLVPQMNVMMISFVVNIGLGLFVMFLISGEYYTVSYEHYVEKLSTWFKLVS